jgi:hypothetical protein
MFVESAIKTFYVDFTAVAKGDGHWDMKEGTEVTFHTVDVEIRRYDGEEWSAEISWYHDRDAGQFGLCYTDTGIEGAVREFVSNHPELSKWIKADQGGGSTSGWQDRFLFSTEWDTEQPKGFSDLEKEGWTCSIEK